MLYLHCLVHRGWDGKNDAGGPRERRKRGRAATIARTLQNHVSVCRYIEGTRRKTDLVSSVDFPGQVQAKRATSRQRKPRERPSACQHPTFEGHAYPWSCFGIGTALTQGVGKAVFGQPHEAWVD